MYQDSKNLKTKGEVALKHSGEVAFALNLFASCDEIHLRN